MTKALSILRGRFGRVALLDMDTSLVDHAHPHFHLIFKASGPDQNFVVEGERVPLRNDMLVAVNSWQQHAYVHRQGAERTLFLALYIEPAWLADADRAFVNCAEPGFFPHAGIAITNEINRLRTNLVRRMADPHDRHDELQESILKLCLTVSHGFSDWRGQGARPRKPHGARDYRVGRALRHMRERAAEAVDLDDVARVSGLSRPHFNHLFRSCTGVSPRVYANALRVETAVSRLRQHHDEIGDISEDLGFSAQSNFTRFFQQHTGTSPNQYRRVIADLG
ncbi:helix-turn-helix domain-containing protein [Bradyrhizobium sp.]|uniref:AraC family transcriptional regulator n=1 Tax=Bradyrhizobium sp. TaxID=376 RepID=UPI003C72CF9F